jgi:hypothetical protein
MSKGWGEEDYDDELPDWMLAKNYQNGKLPINRKSVEQIAAEILKKPPIPIILKDPTKG